jgi:hypothetical protein
VLVTGSGTKAAVHDVIVVGAGRAGVVPAGTSEVTVTNVTVSATRNGFEPSCGSTSTIAKSEAFCNANGVFASEHANVRVEGSNLHDNRIGVASKGADSLVTLFSNRIHDNDYGIVSAQGQLAAGDTAVPGDNVVAPNAKAGIYLDKVATDVIAFGNTWVPNVDDADANGKYVGTAKYRPPMCPNAPYGTLDADPPASCTGSEEHKPLAGYQNIVLVDATCPPTGPAVEVGTLALSTK